MLESVEHEVASRIVGVIDALGKIVLSCDSKDRDKVAAAGHLLDFFKPKGKALVNLNFGNQVGNYQSTVNVPKMFEGPAEVTEGYIPEEAQEPKRLIIAPSVARAPHRVVKEAVPREVRFLPPAPANEPDPGKTLDQLQQPRRNDALRERVKW